MAAFHDGVPRPIRWQPSEKVSTQPTAPTRRRRRRSPPNRRRQQCRHPGHVLRRRHDQGLSDGRRRGKIADVVAAKYATARLTSSSAGCRRLLHEELRRTRRLKRRGLKERTSRMDSRRFRQPQRLSLAGHGRPGSYRRLGKFELILSVSGDTKESFEDTLLRRRRASTSRVAQFDPGTVRAAAPAVSTTGLMPRETSTAICSTP